MLGLTIQFQAGSIDVLHCYYAHGEENENFQRRSYWMFLCNFTCFLFVVFYMITILHGLNCYFVHHNFFVFCFTILQLSNWLVLQGLHAYCFGALSASQGYILLSCLSVDICNIGYPIFLFFKSYSTVFHTCFK